MKTTNTVIKLNETFIRLLTGTATMGDIVAEHRAARTVRLASEDAYSRRHREIAEAADPFSLNYCR